VFYFPAVFFSAAYANGAKVGNDDSWHFLVAPYGWMAWMQGNMTVKGNKSDIYTTPKDILNSLDVALEVHLEARKGNITYMLDPTYLKLSDKISNGIGSVEVTMKETLVDFGVYYRFMSLLTQGTNNYLTGETFVGGRYWNMDVDNKINTSITISQQKNWLDPVIGARFIYHINDKWRFSLHGDIGGFDLISKFTWELKLMGMYQFNRYIGIAAGFRAIGDDYKDGKGANEFRFDNVMYGPVAGITFTF